MESIGKFPVSIKMICSVNFAGGVKSYLLVGGQLLSELALNKQTAETKSLKKLIVLL